MTFKDDGGTGTTTCDKDYIFAPEATDTSKWCDGKEVSSEYFFFENATYYNISK